MSRTEEKLALLAERTPAFMSGLQASAKGQAEGPLDARTQQLIYLGALAVLGAEESFRLHLAQALQSGITEEEALHAVVSTYTAGGITPILKVLGAFLPD